MNRDRAAAAVMALAAAVGMVWLVAEGVRLVGEWEQERAG